MNKAFLGLDLGTSSVKLLLYHSDGSIEKAGVAYDEISPLGWLSAIKRAAEMLPLDEVCAIGLSSQVGSYLYRGELLPWSASVGSEELARIKNEITEECFVKEIGMPHPELVSYPLPRLSYIKKEAGNCLVMMPKDFLCETLVGKCVSDVYSWRGLAHAETRQYSQKLLKHFSLDGMTLPPLLSPTAQAGCVTPQGASLTGLPAGIPVYVGCNDFYAALLGMTAEEGTAFDITGTSEHFGIFEKGLRRKTRMVSSPFFDRFVYYGGTAASGHSLSLARRLSATDDCDVNEAVKNAPVFLPYLTGERAPVFDSDARGCFFGISEKTTPMNMAYAVQEGVAFSLYHIYESMGCPPISRIAAVGGAASISSLNLIKATLFSCPVAVCEEKEASALGAARLAAIGAREASWSSSFARAGQVIAPCEALRPLLLARYEVYKSLYPSLKESFRLWKTIS